MPNRLRDIFRRTHKYFRFRKFRREVDTERARKYLFRSVRERPSLYRRAIAFFHRPPKPDIVRFLSVFSWIEREDRLRYGIGFFLTWMFLLAASAYIVTVSSYFAIAPSTVIIERTDGITDINIAYKSIEDIYGRSLFLISSSEIGDTIRKLQKSIKTVSVTRLFPNGLKIILTSYDGEFSTTVDALKQNYLLTRNGVLIREKDAPASLPRLDIVDPSFFEDGFFDYRQAVSDDDIARIIVLRDRFHERFTTLPIARMTYFRKENEVHIALDSGITVIFGLDAPIKSRLELLKFYNDANNNLLGQGGVTYLDIRNASRFFLCRDAGVCRTNLKRIYPEHYR